MTPQFTTPCFVRIDDADKRKEVCEKLEPIGYKIKVDYTDDINPIVVASKLGILHDSSCMENPKFIDCGTDIDLFLALAGMRDDTDMGQWFRREESDTDVILDGDDISEWVLCDCNNFMDCSNYFGVYHRATAAEIVEHFTKTVQSSKIGKK